MKFWIKVQKVMQEHREEIVVAVCDEDLLGKEFGYFKISEHFFKGELVDADTAFKLLEEATIANLVGNKIVNEALKRNFIQENGVKKIHNIMHAQVFLL
ncbi:MAG: DUF424 family protein [Nanoarchaeota archaeon]|nr:DUF424 family protein [Nanoarchaeota archaeon]